MIIYYDCFSGISGDMNLAALLDAGCPEDYLRGELKKIDLGPFDLHTIREKRGAIAGTRVEVRAENSHLTHRTWQQIRKLIEESHLHQKVKDLALKIFHLLAAAEAKVHGTTEDEVHFHEIGAIDSLVDIIGAAIALTYFRPRRVLSSPVELGSGMISCAHGVLPVPAPATMELLKGVPVKRGGQPFEATTPTGAAILRAVVEEFTDKVSIVPRFIGYGIGHNEGPQPNVLRLILGNEQEDETTLDAQVGEIVILETNIDDMTPEETGHLLEVLLAHGAQDVFLTPIIMKKSRPAVKISVLCEKTRKEKMADLLFVHSSTFGLRYWPVTKAVLDRASARIKTPYGEISVKKGLYEGKVIKRKPEYEECKKIAEKHGLPLKKVIDAVKKDEQS
ncbi:MAG TPA: nickel pincer cofactor biosynthesis protein LarC [Syntrophales bacterium]|nr:nickel pincer cofactor biosynthesis protein LarC [Syntrophales bacterium]HOL59530.1 nickel pincer cofactor biosynthesis protein LarC [Syntrophales bacterium]HPO35620.1 nickel pincer cofactor biosynthesis protein LarC [Syntrophales bacterium]